jgi:hypothetical protein
MKDAGMLTLAFRKTLGTWIILTGSTLAFTASFVVLSAVGVRPGPVFLFSMLIGGAIGVSLIFYTNTTAFASAKIDHKLTTDNRPAHLSLMRRTYMLLSEAPLDLAVDISRLLSFTVLSVILVAHLIFESPSLHVGQAAGITAIVCVGVTVFSSFVYPMLRSQSKWDFEYRYRKALSAHALNYAARTLTARDETEIIENAHTIELDALRAIKSYLEYSVTDKRGKSFHVNLIVVSPDDPSLFACVARTSGEVPKVYRKEHMLIASRALEERKPIYIGDFHSSRGRPYRMIWHIPIASQDESTIRGLVAVDSLVPNHLDLYDERESLLFNIIPYLALIRFSLSLRSRNRIWHSIFVDHVAELPSTPTSYEKLHVDKAFDQRVLNVLSAGDLEGEYRNLRRITGSVEPITTTRRLFSTLFQNVEKNNQRIRG